MQVAGQFGESPEDVIGTRKVALPDGSFREENITAGEGFAALAKKMDPARAQLSAQLASQLGYFGISPTAGGLEAASQYGINNPSQMQAASGLLSLAESLGQANPTTANNLLQTSNRFMPQTASMAMPAIQKLTMAGMSVDAAANYAAQFGGSQATMNSFVRAAAGDIGQMSYDSYKTGDTAFRFQSITGQPIYQSSVTDFVSMLNGQMKLGNPGVFGSSNLFAANVANATWTQFAGGSPTDVATALFQGYGSGDTQAMEAWGQAGGVGRSLLHNSAYVHSPDGRHRHPISAVSPTA